MLAAVLLCLLGAAGADAAAAAGQPAQRAAAGHPARTVVTGSTPPPIRGPGINNAALSTRGPGGVPACFQTARYGSNTARFSYHRPAGRAAPGRKPSG